MIVLTSATVEPNWKVATPLSSLVSVAGSTVFPVPLPLTVTDTPRTGRLLASRTRTVIWLVLAPAVMARGEALTVDFEALGVPAVAFAVKVAVPLRTPRH